MAAKKNPYAGGKQAPMKSGGASKPKPKGK